jgi:hypothetical protein
MLPEERTETALELGGPVHGMMGTHLRAGIFLVLLGSLRVAVDLWDAGLVGGQF